MLEIIKARRRLKSLELEGFSPPSLLYTITRNPDISPLFQLGDDSLGYLLSWLDFGGICYVDITVGNKEERSLWLCTSQRTIKKIR